jgi:hypothetical protein
MNLWVRFGAKSLRTGEAGSDFREVGHEVLLMLFDLCGDRVMSLPVGSDGGDGFEGEGGAREPLRDLERTFSRSTLRYGSGSTDSKAGSSSIRPNPLSVDDANVSVSVRLGIWVEHHQDRVLIMPAYCLRPPWECRYQRFVWKFRADLLLSSPPVVVNRDCICPIARPARSH